MKQFHTRTAHSAGCVSASLTVFFGLSVTMILSIFFSLLEVVHFTALKKETAFVADTAAESVFADYCRPLWKEYGILGIDGSYGTGSFDPARVEERACDYLLDNVTIPKDGPGGLNLLGMGGGETEMTAYTLLTDDGGAAFVKQAARAEEETLIEGLRDGWQSDDRTVKEAMDENVDIDGSLEGATRELEEGAKPPAEGESPAPASENPEVIHVTENPISVITDFKSKGILAQVLPSEQEVSDAAFTVSQRVSKRSLNKGDRPAPHVSVIERGMYEKYLLDHFGRCGKPSGHEGLQYEVEYVAAGKESDRENLKTIVERLLLVREAENIAAIRNDAVKMSEVEGVALGVAELTLNPVVGEAVKIGLIAAWAYVESVLDVRLLLQGGTVSFIKTPEEWTSNLSNLGAFLDNSVTAKDCAAGLDYEGYLFTMLSLISRKEIALRGLDLIEDALRRNADYKNLRMDDLICAADFSCTLKGAPAFFAFITLPHRGESRYEFTEEVKMSYLE